MSIRINGKDMPSTANIMDAVPHGTYHMSDNPHLYEIQRNNNFEFIVTGLDGIVKAGYNGDEENATVPNTQEIIRLSASGFKPPHYSQEPIKLQRGNTTVNYAGVMTFTDGSLTLNDYIGMETMDALLAWQNLSGNIRTGKVGLVGDYKKECSLIEYTPDFQVVRTWKLIGCWISSIDESEFSSEDNQKHTMTATIVYDRAEIDTSSAV